MKWFGCSIAYLIPLSSSRGISIFSWHSLLISLTISLLHLHTFHSSFHMFQLYPFDLLPLALYLVMNPASFLLLLPLFVAFVLFVPLFTLIPFVFLTLPSWLSTVMAPSVFTFIPRGGCSSISRSTVSSNTIKSSSIITIPASTSVVWPSSVLKVSSITFIIYTSIHIISFKLFLPLKFLLFLL